LERFLPRDPTAFRHDKNLVCFDPFNGVDDAARPANFETIGLCCFVQPEVYAQIVLSLIARSGLDVARESFFADGQFQQRSDRIAVAFGSNGADDERAVAIPAIIPEKIGSLAVIADDHVQITVVVQITGGERAADFLHRESRAGYRTHIVEPAFAVVLQEKILLFVRRVVAELADVVDDVSVRYRQIEILFFVIIQ
jgi:hypothetical protein